MIHIAPKSNVSDSGTTATSPPFSPFSPANSVASDNTGTSDEPADLGAFTSVFRALSQLHVQHPPRTMTSLAAIPPSIEEDETDDDDTDRNFNSDDDDDDSFHDALSAEEDDDEDVVTPSRDAHEKLGSDTDGTAEKHTDDSDDNQSIAAAYVYDVESAVEAEESRTVWSHEPIASYLVAAATPAPAQQAARLRQVSGEYNARAGRGIYVDAPQVGEDSNVPPALQAAHHALLSQTHMQAEQTLIQTNFYNQTEPAAPYQPTEHPTRPKLPPVFVPPPTHPATLPNQHVPRTPGPGDPSLGALEQALEFLAAERTRVASQLDSSIEDYAYRTNEGKRRRRKRKKGVRGDLRPDGGVASIPLSAINVGGAGFASNLSLNKVHTPNASKSGNSNHSGSAHERTDTAVPSPSEGTSFSSSSADPRTARHSYLRDGEVPPVPMIGQRSSGRQSSFGSGYSRPALNPNMLAHEIIASYSVPTPPPTGRRPPRRGQHGRGPSYDAPRGPGYDVPPPVPDARMSSIGQRLSGGSGSGSSPTGLVQGASGESKVARLRMLAANLAKRFPGDATALRRAAEGGGGTSFEPESLLYVFVDHSNILVGFLEYLKKNPQLLPPSVGSPKRLKPKILHTALVLLLERGRPCARRILVASSPLHQTLDGVVGMGYEVSVLQRVEIKEGDGASPRPRQTRGPGVESSEDDVRNGVLPPPAPSRINSNGRRSAHHRHPSSASDMSAPGSSRPRFREEAVDELLQLKLLQTILDTPPATIVLATGDGASSQFNPDGFIGCAKRAVERGWRVELVAWDEGVNRVWRDLEREVQAKPAGKGRGSFVIISLEQWVAELIDL